MDDNRLLALMFGGVLLFSIIGVIAVAWEEIDKNAKCAEILKDSSLDEHKHSDIVRRFCF